MTNDLKQQIDFDLNQFNEATIEACEHLKSAINRHGVLIEKAINILFICLMLLVFFLLLEAFVELSPISKKVTFISIIPQIILYIIVIIILVRTSSNLKTKALHKITDLMNVTSTLMEETHNFLAKNNSDDLLKLSSKHIKILTNEIKATTAPAVSATEVGVSAYRFIWISLFSTLVSFLFFLGPLDEFPLYVISFVGLVCAISCLVIVSFRPVSIVAIETTYEILTSALAALTGEGGNTTWGLLVSDESSYALRSHA